MKNIYTVVFIVAALALSACNSPRGSKGLRAYKKEEAKPAVAKPPATEQPLSADEVAMDPRIQAGVDSFKASHGYNVDLESNIAFAKDIGGAEMTTRDAETGSVNYNVVLKSTCEWFEIGLGRSPDRPFGRRADKVYYSRVPTGNDMHVTMTNKCIGPAEASCDTVALLVKHTEGDQVGQTVLVFTKNDIGTFDLVGSPESTDGSIMSSAVDYFKAGKCEEITKDVPREQ